MLVFVFALFFSLPAGAQEDKGGDVVFSAESGTFAGTTMPYRKALLGRGTGPAALVVYLHGGSSKGNDNRRPVAEEGVARIAGYLNAQAGAAVMLVPQCPASRSWGGTMNPVLRALIESYTRREEIDADRVYVLGGSMGGTGTWSLVAACPDLFAAAMPVAGNPSGVDAATVARTPIYTVMGTADAIMDLNKVTDFVATVRAAGGEVNYDMAPGWTHEETCIESYTPERLAVVFGHVRGGATGIGAVPGPSAPAVTGFFDLSGRRLTGPLRHDAYIVTRRASNGREAGSVVVP